MNEDRETKELAAAERVALRRVAIAADRLLNEAKTTGAGETWSVSRDRIRDLAERTIEASRALRRVEARERRTR